MSSRSEIVYERRTQGLEALMDELSSACACDVFAHRADHAILAHQQGKVIGLFAYSLRPANELSALRTKVPAQTRVLCANGTMVRPHYRRRGIGAELWLRALHAERVRHATVQIASSHAVRMLRKVEQRNPHVRLHLNFGDGMRSARAWRRDHGEA